MILLVLAWVLPRAVLSPDQPGWRLLDLPVDSCRVINRLIFALAVVFTFETFLIGAFASLPQTVEAASFFGLIMASAQALFILALVRGRLWQLEPAEPEAKAEAEPEEPDEPDEDSADKSKRFWQVIRILAATIAVAAVVANLLGYAWLGFYLIKSLIHSALIAGGLFLLRGLGRELVGAGLRSF